MQVTPCLPDSCPFAALLSVIAVKRALTKVCLYTRLRDYTPDLRTRMFPFRRCAASLGRIARLRFDPPATTFATSFRSCSYSNVDPSARVTFTNLVFIMVLPICLIPIFGTASTPLFLSAALEGLNLLAVQVGGAHLTKRLCDVPVVSSDRQDYGSALAGSTCDGCPLRCAT